jgi:putative endonuclease
MTNRKRLGDEGERKAAHFLEQNNFIIIEQNYRCKFGEIDIVAFEKDVLVAVEVKTRRNTSFGMPCESVTARKRRHIERCLSYYVVHKGLEQVDMRIDIIEILSTKSGCYLNHIRNAF